MASGGRGAGRGGLLEMMKKKKEEEQRLREEEERRLQIEEENKRRQEDEEKIRQEEAERLAQEASKPAPSIMSRGRGSIMDRMKQSRSSQDSTSPLASTTASVTSTQTSTSAGSGSGPGRGALLGAMRSTSVPGASTTASYTSTQTTSTSSGSGRGALKRSDLQTSGETTGVLGRLSSLALEETRSSASDNDQVISRQGESGKQINLSANYVKIKIDESKGMFQYEVKFTPDIDNRKLRTQLLRQHAHILGNARTFDGTLLYLPFQLPDERTVWESVHPSDETVVTLTVIFKKKQAMKDNISFFNHLINKVLYSLKLVRIGRHDYNPGGSHKFPQFNLEVWPGYVTAVNEMEGGLLLNLDASYRVMRTDTVRDLMKYEMDKSRDNFKNRIATEVIGTSVLTRYNNRTYRIVDIVWDKNPMNYTFEKGGESITLFDYYKTHHNTTIKDLNQPLLLSKTKIKTNTGGTTERDTMLIPELCFTAGLTDSTRSNFTIMKELATITKVNPEQRRTVIKRFVEQVHNNEESKRILSDWGLELDIDTTSLAGRVLDPEEITFGNNVKTRSANADWSRDATKNKVLRTPNLRIWTVICTEKNRKNCQDFLETMFKVCERVNIKVDKPTVIYIRRDDTESYVTSIRESAKKAHQEMIVAILPTQREDKYSAIKKVCCVEYAIASQVIIAKTISRPDRIKSVTEKIVLQINCKLGGALWALKNPFSTAMVCGVDVFHGGAGSTNVGSVAAFVASMDPMLTTWHSRVCLQGPRQEIIDLLKQCFLSSLAAYREKNGNYPDKIFIYRDGVGDGQLETVKNYEIKQYLDACTQLHDEYKPKVTVVIVQKRVNTRIFEKKREMGNPPPGTIVDSHVTRRHLYDFYLVPQLVRQGTVTPTHYIVLYDCADLKTDHMQRFTYKLCHLYYNWPGTIRVPAPCQYAHKLAYLVGQNIKSTPDQKLNNFLYYL